MRKNCKTGQLAQSAIEFRQGEHVIIYKNRALLGKKTGPGVVPQLIRGLWTRAERWLAAENKAGLTSGIDGMWRDALAKHPHYFVKL